MNLPKNSELPRSTASRVQPGQVIRDVRLQRGLSLRELARRIGLNPSHLSKIERGIANPSVGALWMVSDELGIPVANLFSRETTEAPASTSGYPGSSPSFRQGSTEIPLLQSLDLCVDPGRRETIKMAGVEFRRLTPHDDATIEFLEVRHEVGAGDAEAYRHRGREYGVCVQGRLQVEVGFRNTLWIRAGA